MQGHAASWGYDLPNFRRDASSGQIRLRVLQRSAPRYFKRKRKQLWLLAVLQDDAFHTLPRRKNDAILITMGRKEPDNILVIAD